MHFRSIPLAVLAFAIVQSMPSQAAAAFVPHARVVVPPERFVRYVPVTGNTGDLLEITLGPDGALWFTETTSNAIGRIDAAGHVKSFAVPSSAGVPIAITGGADGNVWFTLAAGAQQGIGRITPAGAVTTFPFGNGSTTELDITSGPDGNLWFTDFWNNMVGRVTPKGAIQEFALPTPGAPLGITLGPDRNLWICEEGAFQGSNNVPGRILRMTTAGQFTSYILTPRDWTTAPQFITTGPDGNLWFTEVDQSATPFNVEKITPSGVITKYALTVNPQGTTEPPFRITTGSDGNLWLTETLQFIDRVTTSGMVVRYAMPTPPKISIPAQPRGIASGPHGALWWVETSTGSIGILKP